MAYTFAIDTRWVESSVPGAGTKTYIDSLVKALLDLDRHNRYHLWGGKVPVNAPNMHVDSFGGTYRRAWQLVWKTIGWPTVDLIGPRPDLWHFTNYVAPPTAKPFVVTIHDLGFVHHPEFTEPKNLEFLRKWVPDTLDRARLVIAVSEATKEALIEEYKVPLDKIEVVHEAADDIFSRELPEDDVGRVKEKYGIEGDYFLAVGTLEPRKNLKTLLMALAGLRKEVQEQLVVVGGQGWLFDETQELLAKLGLESRVIFTDYVPKAELPALYQGAQCFVFPSHYEGFGIPVLEAMASGTPVISSNTSSLPEIGGGAALYFDPNDSKGLKHALTRLLQDENLRTRLAEAGRRQAAKFSWAKTAQHTLGVYERALQIERRKHARR